MSYPFNAILRSGTAGSPSGSPGWVSGRIASAEGDAAVVEVFDLGTYWMQTGLLQISIKASAAVASIAAFGSDDGSTNDTPLAVASTGLAFATSLSGAGTVMGLVLPSGRYVRFAITNGAGAQDANSGVRITAFPA